jgi:hypothetical protein
MLGLALPQIGGSLDIPTSGLDPKLVEIMVYPPVMKHGNGKSII